MSESLVRDVRIALRSLLRTPLFTVIAVLTLALGIGGTATMFTAVNSAFLQPLPYPDADRLTMVWQTFKENRRVPVSMLNALDWVNDNRSFEHMAAYGWGTVNVTSGDEPQRSPVALVTRDFFSVMGLPPLQGRTFSAEEMVKGGPPAVIIGERLWRRVFQADPAAVGKPIGVEGVPYTVVGVMPEKLSFPEKAEIWLPLPSEDGSQRTAHNYRVVARLKEGTSLAQAQAEMDNLGRQLASAYPEANAEYGIAVTSLRRDLLGRTGPVLLLLLGAVFLVLLIACANVVNLLFVRSVARQGETTVRLALGANRPALVRPFLLESVLLALLGGGLGLALAFAGRRLLTGLAPAGVLDPQSFQVDGVVVFFTFLLTLAVGLVCGLAPSFRASRQDLRTALAAGGRSVLGNAGRRSMNALIVAEVALAFVLLVGAGLLIRSAQRLQAVDPGFKADNVALLSLSMGGLPGSKYNDDAWRVRFFSQLLDRTAALPGIRAAGLVSQLPLSGGSFNGTLEVEDKSAGAEPREELAHYRLIGGGYFSALGIPVLRGRPFSGQDRGGAQLVAIVNNDLARTIAGEGDVLGQRVKIPGMDGVKDWATVVGVVGDVRHSGLARDPVPEVYFPYEQRPGRTWEMTLAARGEGSAITTAQRVREEIRVLDPGLPAELNTMSALLDADLAQPRFRALLLGAFAAIALILAAVGIFGVVSYAVSRRNREVGIRMALGADRGSVRKLMLLGGLSPVLLGIVIGIVTAFVLTRVLASLVFEVKTSDPLTFVAVALVLTAAAFAATYVPALRATRVDPVDVLRTE
jgi:putative ABC transport system permease protein